MPDYFEKAIASFYGAIAVALFFWMIFVNFNDVRIAVATAVIFGLGTSMWSTATRALWQHGPLDLMLILAMLLLFYARRRAALAQYASIPLALSFIMRPTAAIPIAVFSAYVLICYRPWFVRFMLWAICIAVPWMAFNIWTWGMVVPPYYLPGTAVSVAGQLHFRRGIARQPDQPRPWPLCIFSGADLRNQWLLACHADSRRPIIAHRFRVHHRPSLDTRFSLDALVGRLLIWSAHS